MVKNTRKILKKEKRKIVCMRILGEKSVTFNFFLPSVPPYIPYKMTGNKQFQFLNLKRSQAKKNCKNRRIFFWFVLCLANTPRKKKAKNKSIFFLCSRKFNNYLN